MNTNVSHTQSMLDALQDTFDRVLDERHHDPIKERERWELLRIIQVMMDKERAREI